MEIEKNRNRGNTRALNSRFGSSPSLGSETPRIRKAAQKEGRLLLFEPDSLFSNEIILIYRPDVTFYERVLFQTRVISFFLRTNAPLLISSRM